MHSRNAEEHLHNSFTHDREYRIAVPSTSVKIFQFYLGEEPVSDASVTSARKSK